MRNDEHVLTELKTARAEYHQASQLETAPQLVARQRKIEELMAELSGFITKGANPCPQCGNLPHGIAQPDYYEVGCLVDKGVHSKGRTPERTVEAWNRGEYFASRPR